MSNIPHSSTMVDHIPVIWFEPQERQAVRRLAMFVPPFSGTKENMAPYLQDLAAAGYIALSLDAWLHGERSTELTEELQARVFGNFRRYMWPIIGQTTLDVLKIIDWAISSLGVEEHIRLGGLSMGGDISVAAAGLDQRIERVAAVVATPDWQRPGMQDLFKPGTLLPQGEPDAYARYFYDHLNPLTHLAAFAHGPAINFICGAEDTHVPPDGAQRFQAALREISPTAADNIHIQLLPGMGHMDFVSPQRWWPNCLTWLTEA